MTRRERVDTLFMKGYNCSQTVFALFAEDYGLDANTAAKIATGFGSGARKANICGAVSGGMMALGLAHGQQSLDDAECKKQAYILTDKFLELFEEKMGSLVCKDLMGYDVMMPEEMAMVQEKGLMQTVCKKAIINAVEIVETLI